MKTEISSKEYVNIYEVCNWNSKAVSIVLKRLGYSDELIVEGHLWLGNTPIKSLVNVKEVRGYLDLRKTPIQDLGVLKYVGGYLDLDNTPISKKYSVREIRQMVKVKGGIYL